MARYAEIGAWPLREALLAMVARMKRDAFDAYERGRDRYMHGRSLKDMPPVPPIIEGEIAAASVEHMERDTALTANG